MKVVLGLYLMAMSVLAIGLHRDTIAVGLIVGGAILLHGQKE